MHIFWQWPLQWLKLGKEKLVQQNQRCPFRFSWRKTKAIQCGPVWSHWSINAIGNFDYFLTVLISNSLYIDLKSQVFSKRKTSQVTSHKQRNMNRHSPELLKFLVPLLFFLFHTSYGEVGTAALYSPPYSPTACYGSDASQFPSRNLFAAAGDGIWDNGAACGRLYLVRCITTASTPYACNQNQTIQIKIVGYIGQAPFAHSTYNATMVLSNTAFGTIANSSTGSSYINIEFEQ